MYEPPKPCHKLLLYAQYIRRLTPCLCSLAMAVVCLLNTVKQSLSKVIYSMYRVWTSGEVLNTSRLNNEQIQDLLIESTMSPISPTFTLHPPCRHHSNDKCSQAFPILFYPSFSIFVNTN